MWRRGCRGRGRGTGRTPRLPAFSAAISALATAAGEVAPFLGTGHARTLTATGPAGRGWRGRRAVSLCRQRRRPVLVDVALVQLDDVALGRRSTPPAAEPRVVRPGRRPPWAPGAPRSRRRARGPRHRPGSSRPGPRPGRTPDPLEAEVLGVPTLDGDGVGAGQPDMVQDEAHGAPAWGSSPARMSMMRRAKRWQWPPDRPVTRSPSTTTSSLT